MLVRRAGPAGWRGGQAGGLGRTDDATTQRPPMALRRRGGGHKMATVGRVRRSAREWVQFGTCVRRSAGVISTSGLFSFTNRFSIYPTKLVGQAGSSADYAEITKQGRIDQRRGGGTGRRIGLKIRSPHKGRVGSIPAPGNHQSQVPWVPSPWVRSPSCSRDTFSSRELSELRGADGAARRAAGMALRSLRHDGSAWARVRREPSAPWDAERPGSDVSGLPAAARDRGDGRRLSP